jgi:hypothetical protein
VWSRGEEVASKGGPMNSRTGLVIGNSLGLPLGPMPLHFFLAGNAFPRVLIVRLLGSGGGAKGALDLHEISLDVASPRTTSCFGKEPFRIISWSGSESSRSLLVTMK